MTEQPASYFTDSRMSNSELRLWRQCPAKAKAVHEGRWTIEPTDAMLLGSLVDIIVTQPEQMDAFKAENPDIFTQKGELRATFKHAEVMVERLKREPVAWNMLTWGEPQKMLTGEIAKVEFKGLLDVVHPGKRIFVDLKTTRTLGDVYNDGWEKWYNRYWTQMAIYRELTRQTYGEAFEPVIVGVSSEKPPGVDGVAFSSRSQMIEDRLQMELRFIEEDIEQIMAMRTGEAEAEPCSLPTCDYCRETAGFDLKLAEM